MIKISTLPTIQQRSTLDQVCTGVGLGIAIGAVLVVAFSVFRFLSQVEFKRSSNSTTISGIQSGGNIVISNNRVGGTSRVKIDGITLKVTRNKVSISGVSKYPLNQQEYRKLSGVQQGGLSFNSNGTISGLNGRQLIVNGVLQEHH